MAALSWCKGMALKLSPYGGVGGQFFDNNGDPLSGGKIYTYAAGTTTPLATYTSVTGSAFLSNPIILNAAGRVPTGEIWLTDGLQYKFVLKDANDATIATYDNVSGINGNVISFSNLQEIQTSTAGQTVFNLTTMQYVPGTNSLSVFVDGVNQYGPGAQYAYTETSSTSITFNAGLPAGKEVKFTASQLNTSGGPDAYQISYTAPFTGAVATNVGARLTETLNVKDFGAVGDGSADDTAAINAAIARANITGSVSIYFPSGSYLVSSGLNPITKSNVYLTADAPNTARIIGPATSHTLLRWGDDAAVKISGGGVINLGLIWPSLPAAGSLAIDLRNLANWRIDGSVIEGPYSFLRCGNSAAKPTSIVYVKNVTGFVGNSGAPAIDLRYGAGFFMENCQLHVFGVVAPVDPAPLSVVAGTHFLVANTGTWDTIELSSLLVERFDTAILCAPGAGAVVNNIWITACIFDLCNSGIRFVPAGGTVAGAQVSNSWFGGWDTHALEIGGTSGGNSLHQFNNCKFFLTGLSAVTIAANATNWIISNCEIYAANRKNTGGAAMVVAATSAYFQIIGCAINFDTAAVGLPYSAPYGLSIGSGCDEYLVTNNRVYGSTAAFDVGADVASAANRLIRNNRRASYAGNKVGGIYVLPTSGTPWVNTTPFDIEVSIYGGTVSSLAKNGVNITNMTSGTLTAQPGNSITVFYTVAPAMLFYVLS